MPTKNFVQTFLLLTIMPSAILWLHAQASQNVPGMTLDRLELHDVKAEAVNYNFAWTRCPMRRMARLTRF